ncbi:hypothetical protein EUX98_g1536 [Antrodiella citrinella]|uniref:BTB domain-containing protein n=1 Tax=Antrodiella citrinella TaxID=2447956 RepID=A0A4V3XJD6_9APHY|nr:hypothetical protein EUX98_g1536 [Antrodiella citrinella]
MSYHRDSWENKGDLAIIAPMSNGESQLFRVNSHLLSHYSEPLRHRIQNTQQRTTCKPDYKELPMIQFADTSELIARFIQEINQVENDGAAEVVHPLGSLGLDFSIYYEDLLEFATRYYVTKLADKRRKMFRSAWPNTLDDWTREEQMVNNLGHSYTETRFDNKYLEDFFLQEPVFSIHIARRFDMPEILPWLSTTSRASPTITTARWEYLCAQDHIVVRQVRVDISAFIYTGWSAPLRKQCLDVCTDPSRSCDLQICHVVNMQEHIDEDEDGTYCMDPLKMLHCKLAVDVVRVMERYHLCEACAQECKRQGLHFRKRLWHELPRFFGLPPWPRQAPPEEAPPAPPIVTNPLLHVDE